MAGVTKTSYLLLSFINKLGVFVALKSNKKKIKYCVSLVHGRLYNLIISINEQNM